MNFETERKGTGAMGFEHEPPSMCYDAGTLDMDGFAKHWQEAKSKALKNGLKVIEHGWEQHVIIDEAKGLVHRYPRHQSASDKLADEVAVLGSLNKRTWSVEIPEIIEHHDDFTTYRLIVGEVLNHHNLAHLHERDTDRIGAQLGNFLAELHQFDPKVIDTKKTKQTTSLLSYYRGRIEAGSSSTNQTTASQQLNDLLSRTEGVQVEAVVVHGDLHGLNMVVNMDRRELVGVIDFSELEVGDPHQDFRKIFMADVRLLVPAIQAYGSKTSRALDIELIKLWAYVNEWANVCHFATEPGNETRKRAESHLRKWGQLD